MYEKRTQVFYIREINAGDNYYYIHRLINDVYDSAK